MVYTMNRDMEWLLRELQRDGLADTTVTLEYGDVGPMKIAYPRLLGTNFRCGMHGIKPARGGKRLVVHNDEFHWDFPVDDVRIEQTFDGIYDIGVPETVYAPAKATIRVTAGDISFEFIGICRTWREEVDGLIEMVGPQGSVGVRELKQALKEIDRLTKERNDARYEKLKIEELVSSIRGNLKNLLGI